MWYHHIIMPRTTVDIDGPILRDIKKLQKREGKAFSRIVSDLLAEALGQRRSARPAPASFRWISQPLGLKVDLRDKDAVWQALDQADGFGAEDRA
jgi:hypothetical protein